MFGEVWVITFPLNTRDPFQSIDPQDCLVLFCLYLIFVGTRTNVVITVAICSLWKILPDNITVRRLKDFKLFISFSTGLWWLSAPTIYLFFFFPPQTIKLLPAPTEKSQFSLSDLLLFLISILTSYFTTLYLNSVVLFHKCCFFQSLMYMHDYLRLLLTLEKVFPTEAGNDKLKNSQSLSELHQLATGSLVRNPQRATMTQPFISLRKLENFL